MYKDLLDYGEKEVGRTFRRFMEIEMEHINKITNVIYNLGAHLSLLIEGGNIIGKLFGITIKMAGGRDLFKACSFIEKNPIRGTRISCLN